MLMNVTRTWSTYEEEYIYNAQLMKVREKLKYN